MRACLLCLYVLIAVLPVVLAFAFSSRPDISLMWELGRVAGLLGFSLLSLQVALGSRLKIADRAFGLDSVVAFHKKMAIVCGLLILAHPLLLAVGMRSTYILAFNAGWQVGLGKIAFLLLSVTVLSAEKHQRKSIHHGHLFELAERQHIPVESSLEEHSEHVFVKADAELRLW